MLILEGAQGIGKSQALRILGGQFYAEYSGSMTGNGTGHKDMVAMIMGKMIIEMSELATVRKADMDSLKAVLTTTVDEVRLSYERDSKAYPRTCVFAGTTNDVGQAYIADLTGARRFWPVHTGECTPVASALLRQDRDQLWAEAVHAYESGEDWFTVPKGMVLEEQLDRQITVEYSEPWYLRIRNALTDPDSYANGIFHAVPEFLKGAPTGKFVIRAGPSHLILGILLLIETSRQSPADALRLGKILRAIGFVKTRPSRGWIGSTYAYDLHSTAAGHLWSAIVAAKNTVKYPHTEMNED